MQLWWTDQSRLFVNVCYRTAQRGKHNEMALKSRTAKTVVDQQEHHPPNTCDVIVMVSSAEKLVTGPVMFS